MKFGLSDKDLSLIIDEIQKIPEIKEVLIFGSRAKGNYKPGSDIDMAIKGENISISTVANLSYQLNEENPLPYFFDILHYEKVTEPKLIEHINRVGKVIYRID